MKKKILLALITLSLIVLSCKDKDEDPPDDPQPHQSTITAFGKTATVTGDASISTADFNTGVENLQEVLVWMDGLGGGITTNERNGFTAMMTRTITIVIGNADPTSVNKALTVGVGYLKTKTKQAIGNAIADLAAANAFAD
jgi:hypothetical protein